MICCCFKFFFNQLAIILCVHNLQTFSSYNWFRNLFDRFCLHSFNNNFLQATSRGYNTCLHIKISSNQRIKRNYNQTNLLLCTHSIVCITCIFDLIHTNNVNLTIYVTNTKNFTKFLDLKVLYANNLIWKTI
jgi:hypothetical protein